MKLRVIRCLPHTSNHEVVDEEGNIKRVDLRVNGDFPKGTTDEQLVGNTYECTYIYPCEYIAMDVNPEPVK